MGHGILGWEAWLIPRNTPLPHLSYLAERGRSTLNDVRMN